MKFKRIKGMIDLLGYKLSLFEHILELVKNCAEQCCYQTLVTPLIEKNIVFYRTLGEYSDILSKETYTFLDRDESLITLRPEFTASIVRSILSNNLLSFLPLKIFTFGPVLRHERPQRGRLRQFHQFNFEYILQ